MKWRHHKNVIAFKLQKSLATDILFLLHTVSITISQHNSRANYHFISSAFTLQLPKLLLQNFSFYSQEGKPWIRLPVPSLIK